MEKNEKLDTEEINKIMSEIEQLQQNMSSSIAPKPQLEADPLGEAVLAAADPAPEASPQPPVAPAEESPFGGPLEDIGAELSSVPDPKPAAPSQSLLDVA